MKNQQINEWIRRALNLHPNDPVCAMQFAAYRYVAKCAEQQALADAVPARAPWNGLSDRQKLFFVKNCKDMSIIEIVEAVEHELKLRNT
jgi:hypothetical protein